jgi:hypothetical protein
VCVCVFVNYGDEPVNRSNAVVFIANRFAGIQNFNSEFIVI